MPPRPSRSRPEPGGLRDLAVFMVFATLVATILTVVLHRRSDLNAAIPPPPPSNAVVFVIDGAPADLHAYGRLPHIAALAAQGTTYRQAWLGQLEGVPPASDASIGTGALPRRHGVVGWEWRNPANGGLSVPTSNQHVQNGGLDQVLQSSGVPSLAGALKTSDPRARVMSVSGQRCAQAAALGTWLADYVVCPAVYQGTWVLSSIPGHRLPPDISSASPPPVPVAHDTSLGGSVEQWPVGAEDSWVADATVTAMRETRPRLIFVDFPEPAAIGRYVPDSQRESVMRTLMQGIDSGIGRIEQEIRRQHLFGRTVFVVTGNQSITPGTQTVTADDVDQAILAGGGEKVYATGDAGLFLGVRDRLQARPVAQDLQSRNLTAIRAIYYKSQDQTLRYAAQYESRSTPKSFFQAESYLLGTVSSPNAPDVIAVYKPGAITSFSKAGTYSQTAGGVGLDWNSQHVPLIVAGPNTASGTQSNYPARLVDIAPTIAAMLQIPLTGTDGVALANAELQPSKADLELQQSAQRRLQPVVDGLRGASGR